MSYEWYKTRRDGLENVLVVMIRTEKGRLFDGYYREGRGKDMTIEKAQMKEESRNRDWRALGLDTNSYALSSPEEFLWLT